MGGETKRLGIVVQKHLWRREKWSVGFGWEGRKEGRRKACRGWKKKTKRYLYRRYRYLLGWVEEEKYIV
jgi:hypothetical protein